MKSKLSGRDIIPSLILNLFVFLATTTIIVSYFFGDPGPLLKYNYETFRYFTTDSNVLAAVACLILSVCQIMVLSGKAQTIPKWVIPLKYVGTVSVALTFFTVMFFLMPIYGLYEIAGDKAHVHVCAPLLCMISFCFWEPYQKLRFRSVYLALIPTVIYGIVYLIKVVIIGEANGGWWDFYQFNRGGQWYLSIIIMTGATFLIGWVMLLLHNMRMRRKKVKSH